MKRYTLVGFLSILFCCHHSKVKIEGLSTEKSEFSPNSIENNYEREQIENLKLQDTLLGYMGYSSIDQYQLSNVTDRVYRLTIFEAIGPKFTILELLNDSSTPQLKRTQYTLHKDCNPITGTKTMSTECFVKLEQYEKNLTSVEFDSLKTLTDKSEIFDLKVISQKFRDDIIFDGESWRLEILYMIHDTQMDSNYVRKHTVYRFLPEYFNSIYSVGSYINQLGTK